LLVASQAAVGNATTLVMAKVIDGDETRGLAIAVGDEIVAARVSFGCLVRPVAGDRVLAARGPEGTFVLCVLERLLPDWATLCLPSGGSLALEAQSFRVKAREEVAVDAHSVMMRSHKFNIIAESLTLLGRLSNWVAERMQISARTQEVVADTLSSKTVDRVAVVERADVLRAQSLSQTIDGVAVTTAPIAVIATTEDLRLDGKRVTVG
jgi:hypothetical protein